MDAPVVLRFVPFELPIAVPEPPEGEQWVHEIKFDGYRTQLVIDHGRVSIFSRRGLDWTSRYPGIAASAKGLPVDSAIIEVAGLPSLAAPHDLLIGRNILARCRLVVDFVAGRTSLYVKR